MSAIFVLSTAPKVMEAEVIAQALVKERLAAAVNMVPQIDSRYWWRGKIRSGQEVLMLIVTDSSRFDRLSRRIRAMHSYDVPEILALPVWAGSAAYLEWMKKNTRADRAGKSKKVRKSSK